MVNIIVSCLFILTFLLLGNFTQVIKKFLSLITNLFLRLLSFFGIKIELKEKTIQVSEEFKNTYKDISTVKLSKKNYKQKSSIDWRYFTILIIAGSLVIANLGSVSGNAITNWLYEILKPLNIIKSCQDMNVFFTATFFSILSFCVTKLLQRWKETKQQRIEKRNYKIKQKAIGLMNSKELLDSAKKKDNDNYERLK